MLRALWIRHGFEMTVTVLALLLICSGLSHAADDITISLGGTPVVVPINAANKAMLTRRCDKLAPGAPSVEECVKVLIVDMFRGYKVQSAGQDHVDACVHFKTVLTDAQRATIVTQLNGVSPCP